MARREEDSNISIDRKEEESEEKERKGGGEDPLPAVQKIPKKN